MLAPRLRRPAMLLLVHVALVSATFFSFGGYRNQPSKIESDGKYYYQFLLSAWFDGDVDFTNNYRKASKPFMAHEIDHYGFQRQLTATGRPTNIFTTGPAILWSPFFAVAYGAGSALSAAGVLPSPPDGWGRQFQVGVMFAAVVYSALSLVLLYRLLREHFARRAVLTSLLLLFWSTNWLYYCVFEPSMSHVYDLFTLLLFVYACQRAMRQGGGLLHAAAGLAAGLHVLVRTQNIATVLVLLICFTLIPGVGPAERRPPGKKLRDLAVLLAAFTIALLPLAASNLALFGELLTVPQGPGWFLRLDSPNLSGVLFSGRNGLFSHHPVLLIGAAGLALAAFRWRKHRSLTFGLLIPLALVFGAQLWINASAVDWWGGHAFGQRRLLSSLPLFAVGFCALQQAVEGRFRRGPWLVGATTLLAVTLNLYLTVIHVFAWSYDEPHDIIDWLFVRGPAWIATSLGT